MKVKDCPTVSPPPLNELVRTVVVGTPVPGLNSNTTPQLPPAQVVLPPFMAVP
jgi:hypothetical protein